MKHYFYFKKFVSLQVRDHLEAQGIPPVDQSIPPEDILGRSYCRYSGPKT